MKKKTQRHSMFTLGCPDSLWNGHTVYTEKCYCTPDKFTRTKCLMDNW